MATPRISWRGRRLPPGSGLPGTGRLAGTTLLAALASGAAVALAIVALLFAAPDRPPGWEGLRAVLLSGLAGFAATAALSLVPALVGAVALRLAIGHRRRINHAVNAGLGGLLGLASIAVIFGTLAAPLWGFAVIGGAAGGLAASRHLARGVRPPDPSP